MARKKTHAPLDVLINGRQVGRLEKAASGAISFRYSEEWLAWEHRFAASLSLPLTPAAYRGAPVIAVFDNLLPDRDAVRRRVAERMGAQGTDFYSLLEAIGRDCVGAMQFLPEGADQAQSTDIESEPVSDTEVEALLADLARAPLGVDRKQEFRISVAGAQEKTALLRIDGKWHRPAGVTPTTHILKPQLGQIPIADGMIDMSNSVDNEHYCMTLMKAFGLSVAATEIATVGQRRVLVVERFDRHWRNAKQILRLPQEDCCQALGYPPTHKYQSDGGPNMKDIFGLLRGADDPQADAAAFFKSQILFWLIGATDGHAKNFSIFLKPGGRYSLTPFYDVLSAQPAVDSDQIAQNRFRLAMSAGTNRHYRLNEVTGRHFVQSGKSAGLGKGLMRAAINELMDRARDAPTVAREAMPVDFAEPVHDCIAAALATRLPRLSSALEEF
ncbi:toxin HipA [Pacificimonas flava]|jgi:serine/threonine-protein kinase HipA|uniref:Toxin HipA n=3 Tax=Sphingomonadales TaxID=204457 RepID=A0A219B5U7_9SPHN|nr:MULTISPECIES: type II toxin-antitoxin system HipA family toxin [Sphingomonadales]MBL4718754.1 type II toxin-antitoxin system HipA family toxin [Erythrobacter sp.]PCH79551.1 MAG: type II toxin-antitoxin system HipA family toxin [Erythrobacteraceae bacterium]AKM11309.1 toxin HipA [Croceicoccus naphthovorans]MBB3991927.1 serine/threonine-protein kinase HipA [Croceicoccus naphthovorans]MBZ6379007.1 type II toxin-antitoxin system HipA family toxin [Pacificimonas aurantium]